MSKPIVVINTEDGRVSHVLSDRDMELVIVEHGIGTDTVEGMEDVKARYSKPDQIDKHLAKGIRDGIKMPLDG